MLSVRLPVIAKSGPFFLARNFHRFHVPAPILIVEHITQIRLSKTSNSKTSWATYPVLFFASTIFKQPFVAHRGMPGSGVGPTSFRVSPIPPKFVGNEEEVGDERKRESCHQFKDVARKYKMETSLHGLKYIAEDERHILERVFWVTCVLLAWCTAGYLIYKVRGFFDLLIIALSLLGGRMLPTFDLQNWSHDDPEQQGIRRDQLISRPQN